MWKLTTVNVFPATIVFVILELLGFRSLPSGLVTCIRFRLILRVSRARLGQRTASAAESEPDGLENSSKRFTVPIAKTALERAAPRARAAKPVLVAIPRMMVGLLGARGA